MSLSGITEKVYKMFTIGVDKQESFKPDSYSHIGDIVIHLNDDLYMISRSVFTFWDVLGEIGGLYGILFGLFSSLASIFAVNKAENFLASHLFVT